MDVMAGELERIQDEIDEKATFQFKEPMHDKQLYKSRLGGTNMDDKDTGAIYVGDQTSSKYLTGDEYVFERLSTTQLDAEYQAGRLSRIVVALRSLKQVFGAAGTILATENAQVCPTVHIHCTGTFLNLAYFPTTYKTCRSGCPPPPLW
jgi:hypothetical protein